MRFNSYLYSSLTVVSFLQSAAAFPGTGKALMQVTGPLLHAPKPFCPLPNPNASAINLGDIQGDILVGMTKKVEDFFFFQIKNVSCFKSTLSRNLQQITSAKTILNPSNTAPAMVNVAFSQSGLNALGVRDNLNDSVFSGGQFVDAANLGDPGTNDWIPAFKGTGIHGVFTLAYDNTVVFDKTLPGISVCIKQVYNLTGKMRPAPNEGHEHFGYMDGISQPGLNGITTMPVPGQAMIDPGHILLGETGDTVTRPQWARGGSFLAFRQLKQRVPEFNKFLADNPVFVPGENLSSEEASELMGARMFGRWKSGAPVDLSPVRDSSSLAGDSTQNNNFDYSHANFDISTDQTHCPFSAHIRKTVPRADLAPPDVNHHIIRAGIPYGDELQPDEQQSFTTHQERGLAFVAYQSNLAQGFQFLQQKWANNPKFVFGKNISSPGFDPIIGANANAPRNVTGLNVMDPNRNTTMIMDFVVSRGGEYFFVPPISALKFVILR